MTERQQQPPRSAQRGGPPPPPRMRPTNPASLVVAGLAGAAVSWLVIGNFYGEIPPLPWLPPITVFALAVGEGVLARTTKARIDRKPGAAPVDPLAVARSVVLAKASALAGAIFAGFYLGIVVSLLIEHGGTSAATKDLPAAVGGAVASLALVAAALWLERACRVPKGPDDDKPSE